MTEEQRAYRAFQAMMSWRIGVVPTGTSFRVSWKVQFPSEIEDSVSAEFQGRNAFGFTDPIEAVLEAAEVLERSGE